MHRFEHSAGLQYFGKRLISICVLFLASTFSLPVPAIAQQQPAPTSLSLNQNELLFVADVLVSEEFNEKGKGRVVKWVTAPQLSVFGTEDRHNAVVDKTIKEINQTLPTNRQIKRVDDDDPDASVRLYFIKAEAFDSVGQAHGFHVVPNNRGFFNIQWNAQFEIDAAQVLIAEDQLSGRRLSHFVLEEVTQIMGLIGDSNRIKQSVFYEDATLGRFGTTTRLTAMDRKLIRFLYAHVQPGAWPIELGALVERHWKQQD